MHGIQTPSLVFKFLAEALAKAGYRVLAYDNYGRGFSDIPNPCAIPYGKEFYVSQMASLLHSLGWSQFTLLGFSMVRTAVPCGLLTCGDGREEPSPPRTPRSSPKM